MTQRHRSGGSPKATASIPVASRSSVRRAPPSAPGRPSGPAHHIGRSHARGLVHDHPAMHGRPSSLRHRSAFQDHGADDRPIRKPSCRPVAGRRGARCCRRNTAPRAGPDGRGRSGRRGGSHLVVRGTKTARLPSALTPTPFLMFRAVAAGQKRGCSLPPITSIGPDWVA